MPNDPPQHAPPKLLIDLVEYAKSKKISIIVSADSNAHNLVWGSTDNNTRGEELLDFIISKT